MAIWIDKLEACRLVWSRQLEPLDPSGVLRALFLTESRLDGGEGFFRTLGFVHLLRATGIHLYATYRAVRWVTDVFAILLASVGCRISLLALGRFLGASFALWGWVLSGMRPGMLRPLMVVALRGCVSLMGGKWQWWAPLVCALCLDAAWSAWSGIEARGSLPYALAVGGGLAALELVRGRSTWVQHGAMAVGSWLTTALWEGLVHQTVQWNVPWLSLLTIPWWGGVVYPLGLLAAAIQLEELNHVFAVVAGVSNALLALSVDVAFAIPGLWQVPREFWWATLPAALVASVLSVRRRVELGFAAAVLGTLFALWPFQNAWESRTRVVQLDVGQGDAALVWTRGQVGMIDVGSALRRPKHRWVEALAKWHVDRLDFVVLTHLDEDHAGGLETLKQLIPVRCVATHGALVAQHRNAGLWPVGRGCEPIRTWELPVQKGRNGTMVAVWVDGYANAGDAHGVQELRWLVELKRAALIEKLKIWKVSHHGSKTSTHEAWLRYGLPALEALWLSLGRRNFFGHPNPGVMERLAQRKVPILRTDRDVDIVFTNDKTQN